MLARHPHGADRSRARTPSFRVGSCRLGVRTTRLSVRTLEPPASSRARDHRFPRPRAPPAGRSLPDRACSRAGAQPSCARARAAGAADGPVATVDAADLPRSGLALSLEHEPVASATHRSARRATGGDDSSASIFRAAPVPARAEPRLQRPRRAADGGVSASSTFSRARACGCTVTQARRRSDGNYSPSRSSQAQAAGAPGPMTALSSTYPSRRVPPSAARRCRVEAMTPSCASRPIATRVAPFSTAWQHVKARQLLVARASSSRRKFSGG